MQSLMKKLIGRHTTATVSPKPGASSKVGGFESFLSPVVVKVPRLVRRPKLCIRAVKIIYQQKFEVHRPPVTAAGWNY